MVLIRNRPDPKMFSEIIYTDVVSVLFVNFPFLHMYNILEQMKYYSVRH